ncbi:PREDICTED: uncharacterized protein LOC104803120 [Tarenaya hassleriana]|uniref:uncharacterized protein LOC104803120 n=1 Tax=Tarenaya hassleriana TaxID=28532 RepID=UPI0008FD264D|nr:PREDICTED: uncharacterized protein LOC104803120 [Tarenaya hassleriana]
MCSREADSSTIEGYRCRTCVYANFHKECAESPMEMKHPYHPPHPLSLRLLALHEASEICSCCREELGRGFVYQCPICKFFIHLLCAKKPPVLEVDKPKSHDHKLVLLPKPRPFTCDACGLLLDSPSFPWACLECGVMIHRGCIDLPRVIRICRHHHRLRYNSSPSRAHESSWSCGVCRKVVDNNYGAYSCSRGCDYVVHSKCATREDVWDGKDLEGVPEEPEDAEPPFEVIDEKTIHHFSHGHHLKLNEEDDERFDRGKHCRACALPICIHLGNTYCCRECDCDFIIHETCANLPRKMWYMLHAHRLELHTTKLENSSCDVCGRLSSGFIYKCSEEVCRFEIDVNCASVSEPFNHITHPHPLFSTSISKHYQTCSGCKEPGSYYRKTMQCIECEFVLCFRCITLPSKMKYKQDRHPLVLESGGGEETGGESWWCEICERRMDKEVMYYTCDGCCVTVHVDCVVGEDVHMMPGLYSDEWVKGEFEAAANVGCCRPFCHRCEMRCPFPIVFKKNDLHLCTLRCLRGFRS